MIRHGLITELRIIGASEAASLILDMKAQLEKERADLVSARKWAKAWKMQATGERIQKEQAIDGLAEVTHHRNKLSDHHVVMRINLEACRAEIERLNGRRCDGCKHSKDSLTMKLPSGELRMSDHGLLDCVCPHNVLEDEFPVKKDHYCKSWEAKWKP